MIDKKTALLVACGDLIFIATLLFAPKKTALIPMVMLIAGLGVINLNCIISWDFLERIGIKPIALHYIGGALFIAGALANILIF